MDKSQMENLLTALLDCGYLDLGILKDCEFDFTDLIERIEDYGGKVNINSLCSAMFEIGLGNMSSSITSRINELDNNDEERSTLESLDPYEDTESFHNFIDTHIYFTNDKSREIYNKYLKEELDAFEQDTGFAIN